MPTIGKKLAQQSSVVTFAPLPSSSSSVGVSSFTLQAPTTGIQLYETYSNANGAVTLGLRSIVVTKGLSLTVNQGILYVGIDAASLSLISDSPTFTGLPHAPTAPVGTSTTQIATTQFVAQSQISPILSGIPRAPTAAPGTSTTQIATTEYVAANFSTSDSPDLSGSPTAPTGETGDNTTRIATDAFVHTATSGVYTLAVAAGPYVLTPLQYGNKTIILAGALSGDISVVFPNIGHWAVINRTASFTVTLTIAGGTGVVIDPGSNAEVVADGTNLVFANLAITQQIIDSSTNFATTEFVHNVLGADTGTITITSQGGLITLTPTQATADTILVAHGTTAESSSVTLIMPKTGTWVISNRLASHTVTVKTAAGTGVSVDVGATTYVAADGTNVILTQTLQSSTIAVTQPVGDNSTAVATTAYVKNQGYAAKAGDTFTGRVNMTVAGTALVITNNAQITGTLTLGNLAVTTINASDAVSLTGTGVALNVNNDVTVGGIMHVLGRSGWSQFDATVCANADLLCTGTGYLKAPCGTTVQRPSLGDQGSIRHNTTTGRTEFGIGGSWVNYPKLSGDTMSGPLTATALTATGTVSGKVILGADKGKANGYAPLDVNAKVPWANLPTADQNYLLSIFFGGKPASNQIYNYVMPGRMQIAANFGGTLVYDSTRATNPAVFTVNKISGGVTTAVGTITILGTTNSARTLSTQPAVTFNSGDVLQVVAPSTVDETLADVAITIMATGASMVQITDLLIAVSGVSGIASVGQAKISYSPIIPIAGVKGTSKVTNVIIPRHATPTVDGNTGVSDVGTLRISFTRPQLVAGVAGSGEVGDPDIYFSRGVLPVGRAATGGVGNLASAASAGHFVTIAGRTATADAGDLPAPMEIMKLIGLGRAGNLGPIAKTLQILSLVGRTGVGGLGGARMLNALDSDPAISLAGGDLSAANMSNGIRSVRATRGITTGKYCFEAEVFHVVGSSYAVGVSNKTMNLTGVRLGTTAATGVGYYTDGSILPFDPTSGNPMVELATYLFAVDADRKMIWAYDPNTNQWNQDSFANPATGINGISLVATLAGGAIYPTWTSGDFNEIVQFNFGALPFVNATQFAATGFGAWPVNLAITKGVPLGVQRVGQAGALTSAIQRNDSVTPAGISAFGQIGIPSKISVNPGSAVTTPDGVVGSAQWGVLTSQTAGKKTVGLSALGRVGLLTIQNPGFALVAQTSMAAPTTATTPAINTTGADLIVICQTQYSGAQVATLSDSYGNTWIATTARTTSVAYVRISYCRPNTVGVGHTFTLTTLGNNTYGTLHVAAFQGSNAVPFDQQNGATSTSATVLAAGSVTPSQNGCLVVTGLCATDGSSALTVNAPFAVADAINWVSGNNESGGLGYVIQAKTIAANATWNWTGTSHGAVSAVVFSSRNFARAITGVAATAQAGSMSGIGVSFMADFTSALPSGWTFARAGSNATNATYLDTATNVGGAVTTYAANVPRFSPFGMFMEPTRTNLFLNSTAPVTQTISVALGTYVVWMATTTTGTVSVATGTAAGTGFGAVTMGSYSTLTISTAGTIIVTVVAPVQRVQVEAGSSPSSFIVTAGTAAIRSAETLTMTPDPALVNVAAGTYFVDCVSVGNLGYNAYLFSAGSGSLGTVINADIGFIDNTGVLESTTMDGSGQASGTALGSTALTTALTPHCVAVAMTASRNSLCYNGTLGTPYAGARIRPPAITTISIMCGGSSITANGYLRAFKYLPYALTDQQLVAITTPGFFRETPMIQFDFTGPALPGILSYARSGTQTGGTTDLVYTSPTNASVTVFSASSPRMSSVGKGILLEPTATNYLANSDAAVTQTVLVPLGLLTVWLLGTGTVTVTAGTAVGTNFGAVSYSVPRQITITTAGTATFTVSGTVSRFQCEVVTGAGIKLTCPPTSFIKTTTAAQTRAPDRLQMPLGKWFPPGSRTYIAEFYLTTDVGVDYPIFSAGSSFEFEERLVSAKRASDPEPLMQMKASAMNLPTQNTQEWAPQYVSYSDTLYRVAFSVSTSRRRMCMNGQLGEEENNGLGGGVQPLPSTGMLVIGSDPVFVHDAQPMYFRRLSVYDYAMTDAELIAATGSQPPSDGPVISTWDPAKLGVGSSLANNNLTLNVTGANFPVTLAKTAKISGKYYFELTITSAVGLPIYYGIAPWPYTVSIGGPGSAGNGFFINNDGISINSVNVSSVQGGNNVASGDTASIAIDFDNKLIWFTSPVMRSRGQAWNNSATANPATGVGGLSIAMLIGPFFIAVSSGNANSSAVVTLNEGTSAFSIPLPAGFNPWNVPYLV